MRKALPLLVLALLLSTVVGANGEPLKVVASHSILGDVVAAIGTDHIELVTLMPKGSDPHSFQPSPRDLTPLADADVVFINGANFEDNLLPTIENAAADTLVVEASACVEVLPYGAGHHGDEHDDDHDDHADEHDDDHGDDHDDDHADDDHGDEHDDDHGDEHDDDHGDEHDDDHGDEHDDDHGDDHDDDHADEHDDDHGHEHDDDHGDEHDDDHADEHDDDHADEHDDEHGDSKCDAHHAEFDNLIGEVAEAHDHDHAGTVGRLEDIDCGGGHGHHDKHGHDHGSCDPHVWLDPHNVIFWTLQIRDTLSALDSHNAQHFADNAAAYIQELVAIETEFIQPLLDELPHEKRVLITSHDSFGYLAVTFGFEIIGTVIPGGTTTEETSARDLAALIDLIRAEGVPAIFGELVVNAGAMQAIADETGAQLVVLNADTLSPEGEASTYLGYMRSEFSSIVNALKG